MDNSSTNIFIVAIIGFLSSCLSAIIGAFATIVAARISVNRHINETKSFRTENTNENKDVPQKAAQSNRIESRPSTASQTKTKLSGWVTTATVIFLLCFSCYCAAALWGWTYGDALLKQYLSN